MHGKTDLKAGFRRAIGRWMGLALLTAATAFIWAGGDGSLRAADGDAPRGAPGTGEPYMRMVKESPDLLRTDVGVRFFAPGSGSGPTISLVGAVHVGDKGYYEALQRILDSQDLVMYEGVGAPEFMKPGDDKVARTISGQQHVAASLERYFKEKKSYPATLNDLGKAVEAKSVRNARLLKSAMTDAWSRTLLYTRTETGYQLLSHGADGKPGGEGENADLTSDPARAKAEAAGSDDFGIQLQLARALGLTFQLEVMDTTKANYVNSDMTIGQLRDAIAGRKPVKKDGQEPKKDGEDEELNLEGADGEQLLNMLSGQGMMMSIAKVGLKLLEFSPKLRHMTRIMIMEAASQFDGDSDGLAKINPAMGKLMKVLIVERNKVVMEDLKKVLASRKGLGNVAIFYGAGHMPDLEQRLMDELGYKPAGGFWLKAFEANLKIAQMTEVELKQFRNMMRNAMGKKPAAKAGDAPDGGKKVDGDAGDKKK